MMNCQKAEPLIPLFVEDDLETTEMLRVREHIETCGACRDSAASFQASQSSLRSSTLPVFDEAMLAEMRRVVLQQVAPPAVRTAFIEWLQPFWSWKLVFAAAAVVLLVVGLPLRWRGAGTVDGQVANKTNEAKSDSAAGHEQSAINWPNAAQQLPLRKGHKLKAKRGVNVSERNPENQAQAPPRPARATDIDDQSAVAAIAPSGAGEGLPNLPRGDTLGFILPPSPQSENTTQTPEKSTPEPEMLRMEFQTADPNIRIIWLTPKTALAAK